MPQKQLSDYNPDGTVLGQDASDKIGFYGTTAVVRRSGAAQAALTDSSGGTANQATGLATITATYNQSIIANSIATLAASINEIRATLVGNGMWKGSA